MRADERDAYCRFADNVYGRTVWKDDKDERFLGKVCVLGLGFQMGVDKFQMTLAKGALGGPRVNFTRDHCGFIVNTYRTLNYKIVEGWKKCASIIEDMSAGVSGSHKCISWGGDGQGNGWILLPNGMHLKYPDLKQTRNEERGFMEWSYQSKEMRKKIYGGLLCENLVQALARIIVATQMLWIDKKYPCVMTTHDEVVTHPTLKTAEKCYQHMYKCMTTPLWWCPDLPLAAEGGWATNYSK
jgi:DNA polymerase